MIVALLGLFGVFPVASDVSPLDPNEAPAYTNCGEARRYNGDLDGAIADSTRAVQLQPNLADAYNTRGLARDDKSDLDEPSMTSIKRSH